MKIGKILKNNNMLYIDKEEKTPSGGVAISLENTEENILNEIFLLSKELGIDKDRFKIKESDSIDNKIVENTNNLSQ